ncbi:RNA-binding S4 domain-containing protein [Sphingomonas suaedae]|nr:RNA-binding S4 domain-containing protein [Sphingomonas suaedae]
MTDPAMAMRLDRFLWFARLVKTRSAAQDLAETGLMRLDGRRIERSSVQVRVGSVIAFPLRGKVRVLRIEALPLRRGPPSEAATLYQELLTGSPSSGAIA